MRARLRYKGQMIFRKLPSDIQVWYDKWRDSKNREIRKTTRLFQGQQAGKLRLEDISERQRILIERLYKKGFLSYDRSLRKSFVTDMYELRSMGWVEQDRRRRWNLTLEGLTVADKKPT